MIDLEQFKNDYNLDQLDLIEPIGKKFKMWVTPRFREAYENFGYENFTANILQALAVNTDLFVDVGAHYGYFSLLVGKVNPNCKIIAYEPVPENYEIFKRNITLNQIEQAATFNKAISNRQAQTRFNISTASDNCSFIEHPTTPVLRQIEVETITLEAVLSDIPYARAIIKIDTDGHELQVLEGLENVLQTSDNIQLLIELNPKCLRLAGNSPETLLAKLDSLGYDCYYILDTENRLYRPQTGGAGSWRGLFSEESYVNLFCIKKRQSLHVLIFSHSSELAGAERSLLELVKELITDYASMCTVVLPAGGLLNDYLKEQGAATINAPLNLWCTGGEMLDQATIDSLYAQTFSWLVENRGLLQRINPDVVLTNTLVIPWGALTAFMLQRPHLWMVNEFGEKNGDLKFFLPFDEVLEFVKQSSDQVITRSRAIQNELFPGEDDRHIRTIYRFIEKLQPESAAEPADVEFFNVPNACRLFFPGTVMPIKGQEDAVLAVIELVKNRDRSIELLIAGHAEPNYLRRLQETIQSEFGGEYIHIVPFVEHLHSIYCSADIVLMCSKREPAGRVVLEAMLLEKPVIGTNTGGTLELITDGETGLLYPPGDYLALADQIEFYLDHPDLRAAVARRGKLFAEQNFTKERFGGEYRKILMELKGKHYEPKAAAYLLDTFFETSIRHLSGKVVEQDVKIASLAARVDQLNAELTLARAEVLSYIQSTSWRVTRPLRLISRWFKGRKNA